MHPLAEVRTILKIKSLCSNVYSKPRTCLRTRHCHLHGLDDVAHGPDVLAHSQHRLDGGLQRCSHYIRFPVPVFALSAAYIAGCSRRCWKQLDDGMRCLLMSASRRTLQTDSRRSWLRNRLLCRPAALRSSGWFGLKCLCASPSNGADMKRQCKSAAANCTFRQRSCAGEQLLAIFTIMGSLRSFPEPGARVPCRVRA